MGTMGEKRSHWYVICNGDPGRDIAARADRRGLLPGELQTTSSSTGMACTSMALTGVAYNHRTGTSSACL